MHMLTTFPSTYILIINLLFFFFTSVISCTTAPCPPTLPAGSPILPGIPVQPQTPTLPGYPILPQTPIPNLPGSSPTIPKETNGNSCPRDILKMGVCVDMLGRSIGRTIGNPPSIPCCKIIEGLLDFEAAVCVCTAMKANVMGIVYDIPVAISHVFNNCRKDIPSGFQCT